jgi:UDP-glucuronate 4-epimerase
MHVVVTGAAGFVGSHVCEKLVERGHRVTAIDAFDPYLYPAELKRANAHELARVGIEVHEADICDRDAVARAIDRDADVVCHLAALAGVRPSIAEPLRYLRANIEGTGVIVERMRALGLRRLVFASSSSVYGARDEVAAFREDDPCVRPASPYAATKRMNELQLVTYRDLFGFGVVALRYFTVYGPRQRPDMAIAKFLAAIARGDAITLFGDGTSRRDYTYIDDIVAGTVAAIERAVPNVYEIYNLGGTKTISLAELVAICERVVGTRAKVERAPDQPGDVPITFANIDRARAALEYAPTVAIDDGIARQWAWLRGR